MKSRLPKEEEVLSKDAGINAKKTAPKKWGQKGLATSATLVWKRVFGNTTVETSADNQQQKV